MTKEPRRNPDPKNLPYLLQLMDDESEVVQKTVTEELMRFGDQLDFHLKALKIIPTPEQWRLIEQMLGIHHRDSFRRNLKACFGLDNEKEKLEKALTVISEFLSAGKASKSLKMLLDELAARYLEQYENPDAEHLAEMLFQKEDIQGAQEDYYNPNNSNLIYVIENKKGIPISLACIYILVGARLGLDIQGCNFPGHFLARAFLRDEMILVDCFNGGRLIRKEALSSAKNSTVVKEMMGRPTETESIISRILGNLVRAYQKNGDEASQSFFEEALNDFQKDKAADTTF